MRVMVIVKASKESEAGVVPSTEILTKMGKYNEQLVKAGVMLAGDGLQPSSKGKRVRFSGEKRTVIDGPFTETKELIAGYWLWQVRSMDEAVEWLKRVGAHSKTYFSEQRPDPFVVAGRRCWEIRSRRADQYHRRRRVLA